MKLSYRSIWKFHFFVVYLYRETVKTYINGKFNY